MRNEQQGRESLKFQTGHLMAHIQDGYEHTPKTLKQLTLKPQARRLPQDQKGCVLDLMWLIAW